MLKLSLITPLIALTFLMNPFAIHRESISPTGVLAFSSGPSLFDDPETIALAPKFDPRNELTPVKDQGDTNLCWAYSAIHASEANILKQGIGNKDTLRLNPQALAYRKYVRNADPLGNTSQYYDRYAGEWTSRAGAIENTAPVLSMWQGPIGGDKPAANVHENTLYRLESASLISSGLSGAERIQEIKNAVARYGAVTASTFYDGGTKPYYNDKAVSNGIAHAITLIGWDDTLDKSLFKPGSVETNGGWLVKNSYNDNGYFYLTYESKIVDNTSWSFSYAPKERYDYNYYYDNSETDFSLIKLRQCANVFEAKKGTSEKPEYLEAINVGFTGYNVDVTVKVYTDLPEWGPTSIEKGTQVASQTKTFSYGGYQTIVLNQPILLSPGSYFAIAVEVSSSTSSPFLRIIQSQEKKPSLAKGYESYDYILNGSGIARIKAYTKCKATSSEHIHDWGEPTYVWNENNSSVSAKRICKTDSTHIEEETVEVTETVLQEATCLQNGEKLLTSKPFTNPAFSTQTKDIILDYGPHSFGEWIPIQEPTEEQEGIQGHKDCLVCHKHFDQEGNEIQDLSIPKLPRKVTITVINGSSNASKVEVGTSVTVTADKPKEGMQFKGWADGFGHIVSYEEIYTFVATEDITLTAIYERIPVDTSSSENTNSSSSSSSENTSSNSSISSKSDNPILSNGSSSSSESSGDSGSNKPDSPNENTPSSLSFAGIIAISIVSATAVVSLGGVIIYKATKKRKLK